MIFHWIKHMLLLERLCWSNCYITRELQTKTGTADGFFELFNYCDSLTHKVSVLPSYRNQSIDLHSKSIDWFLYEGNTGT